MTQTFHCNLWFAFNFKCPAVRVLKYATMAKEVLESSGRQSASRIAQQKLSSYNFHLKVENEDRREKRD